jgi:antitoxin (DNA-binding transcriptional repressor) of toxin-antitoxin stability system
VVVVTDRGRPIAKMVPVQQERGYESLVDEGRIAPGTGRGLDEVLRDLDEVLPADEGVSVSDALASLRADER